MKTSTPLDPVMIETDQPVTASIIWLHGLGADGHDFADIVPQLQLPKALGGIRFVFPHAPIQPVTLNNGFAMRAWYDIYGLEETCREDRAGIEASQHTITQLIETQIDTGIASNRIILAGFSQGGALALYTGLRYPKPLAGILGLSTYLPLASELNQQENTANQKTPILITHGTHDEILPLAWSEKTRDHLQEAGYSVQWHTYPMGHQVCLPEIEDITRWIEHLLKGVKF